MSLFDAVMIYYGVLSLITLVVYAWDKRASKRTGARRVRERTLHLWALAGGFGGALLGQFWLRHKTKHPSFIIVTVLASALHVGAWGWILYGRMSEHYSVSECRAMEELAARGCLQNKRIKKYP